MNDYILKDWDGNIFISITDEIVKLALYSEVKNKEPIAPIDEKLLEYYKL